MSIYEGVVKNIETIVEKDFPNHPFSHGITEENFEGVIRNYLTMSLAFPYIQSGAQLRLLKHYLDNCLDIPHGVEATAVVGAFLAWDEFGGHAIVSKRGNEGLPLIINSGGFHANMLRRDIQRILGKSVAPEFSVVTKKYLQKLEYGLSDIDPVTRVAHMVAFEQHAGIMIDSLWETIVSIYDIDKEHLTYFRTHVGGDDPGEVYHVQMTKRMIEEVIKEQDVARFSDFFRDAFEMNATWCEKIKDHDRSDMEFKYYALH